MWGPIHERWGPFAVRGVPGGMPSIDPNGRQTCSQPAASATLRCVRRAVPGPDLVGAPWRSGDHVQDALDRGFGEHGTDELDLAGAGLPVAEGHRPDGAVVLADAPHAR